MDNDKIDQHSDEIEVESEEKEGDAANLLI